MVVTDPLHRVLFMPEQADLGSPYASFGYTASDGEADSQPAFVTVHILPPPRLEGFRHGAGGGSAFELDFSGIPGAAYRVQASTNLVDWQVLGPATELLWGQFQFTDTQTSNRPARFYRVISP